MVGAVAGFMEADVAAGENKLKFNCGATLPAGSYLLEIRGEGLGLTLKKVMVIH